MNLMVFLVLIVKFGIFADVPRVVFGTSYCVQCFLARNFRMILGSFRILLVNISSAPLEAERSLRRRHYAFDGKLSLALIVLIYTPRTNRMQNQNEPSEENTEFLRLHNECTDDLE